MSVVNLCPHPIDVLLDDDNGVTYPPSGTVARLLAHTVGERHLDGIHHEVSLVAFTRAAVDLPDRAPGVWYVVSLPFALEHPREDLLVPYDEVRDPDGRIIGCRTLARLL